MTREKVELIRALTIFWRGACRETSGSPIALPPLPVEPLVSVGIVTRGRAEQLSSTLDTLRTQHRPPHEVIVIEHGLRPVRDIAAVGPEVRVLAAPSGGLGAARQLAVQTASGDIVAFTDDDCLPDAAWLKAAVAALHDNPAWWGVQGRTEPEPGPVGAHAVRIERPDPLYQTCNIAYRRSALDRVGGFDTGFQGWFEDTALGARVSAHGPIGWAPDMVVRHRSTPRRILTRHDWHRLLEDERRLARHYPDFYRRVRGPSVPVVVIVRWLLGSPLRTLVREIPQARQDWRGYLSLLRVLFRERTDLVRELVAGW